jgi:hypothetical protein
MQRIILLQKNDLFLAKNQALKRLNMSVKGKHSRSWRVEIIKKEFMQRLELCCCYFGIHNNEHASNISCICKNNLFVFVFAKSAGSKIGWFLNRKKGLGTLI